MRDITIIIPTMGVLERKQTLRRAVESVLSQANVNPEVVIVVNGDKYVSEVLDQFAGNDRVRVAFLPEPGVSRARLLGREMVTTTYFGFLDDDDAFLPLGLSVRVDALEADPMLDVVATNGLYEEDGISNILYDDFLLHEADPMLALVEVNWLCSCGGLYRSASVDSEIFANLPNTMEVTLIAFRLAQKHKIRRLDVPTFVIHVHRFDRLSGSDHYFTGMAGALQAMYDQSDRLDVKRKLSKKLSSNNHDMSVRALESGRFGDAWYFHWKSLNGLSALRYVLFTRHLLLGIMTSNKSASAA